MAVRKIVGETGEEFRFGGPANGRMLTVSEAAQLLSAHPNSIRRWANMGILPAHRIGYRGDRRFLMEDLITFLAVWKEHHAAPSNGTKFDSDDLVA